jgi:hypothetical protein
MNVYQTSGALPRMWVVHQVEEDIGEDGTLTKINSPGFNPGLRAIAEPGPQLIELQAPESGRRDSVTIIDDGIKDVTADVEMAAPGLVILGDPYYPGWQVSVDNKTESMVRTDDILMGVYAPTGHHTIVFSYRPTWLRLGAFLSIGAIAITVILAVLENTYRASKDWRAWPVERQDGMT